MRTDLNYYEDTVTCISCSAFLKIKTQEEDSWTIATKAALAIGWAEGANEWVCPDCIQILTAVVRVVSPDHFPDPHEGETMKVRVRGAALYCELCDCTLMYDVQDGVVIIRHPWNDCVHARKIFKAPTLELEEIKP